MKNISSKIVKISAQPTDYVILKFDYKKVPPEALHEYIHSIRDKLLPSNILLVLPNFVDIDFLDSKGLESLLNDIDAFRNSIQTELYLRKMEDDLNA